jgi:hypothetical protein
MIILTEYCAKISGGWDRLGGGGACDIQDTSSWSGYLKGRDCFETCRMSFLSCSESVAPSLHRKLVSAVTCSDVTKGASCRQ